MEAQRRMVIAEPLWVTSSRTTHVDVMCTSNTVRRYVAPGEKERQQSKSKARDVGYPTRRTLPPLLFRGIPGPPHLLRG